MASLTPERMSSGLFARDAFRSFEAMRQMTDPISDASRLPAEVGVEPAVNLYESDGAYTLECAVSGYSQDDLKVDARADRVTIAGVYFVRTIVLPERIDPDRLAAKLEHGLLTIVLPASKGGE